MRLAIVLLSVGLAFGQSPEEHLAAARTAEASGDFGAAEREYEKAVALAPSAAACQRLGLVRHLQNKFSAAIPAFEQSLRLDPKQWASHLFLGIDLYKTNRFEAALGELQRAAALRPGDADTRFWMGATYLARHEYFNGLVILEKLSAEQPANVEILRLLAENYAVLGTTLLDGVAEKFPDTPAGLQVHAQALESEGANDAALAAWRELAKVAPGRPGVGEAIGRLSAIAGPR